MPEDEIYYRQTTTRSTVDGHLGQASAKSYTFINNGAHARIGEGETLRLSDGKLVMSMGVSYEVGKRRAHAHYRSFSTPKKEEL